MKAGFLGLIACGLLMTIGCATQPAAKTGQRVSLFDGKTFKGWEGDTAKSFRIEAGAIVGGTMQEKIPRNEFLATTRQYTNFVLRLKFKLVGADPNAGVQFRTQRIPNHHEVIGYQADMGQKYWGALYDESRRKQVLAGPKAEDIPKIAKVTDWNDYEIRCDGKRIVIKLNGHTTVDYTEPDSTIPEFGIIAVQIHSGPPTEAWYKEITIEELP